MIEAFAAQWMVPALLVLCRLSGVALFGPILGSKSVPWKARALLVVILTGACTPLVAESIGVVGDASGPTGAAALPSLPAFAEAAFAEIAIGAVIGLLASMPLVAAQIGGLVASQQLGLGFGRFYLPSMDDEGDALEQMMFLLALMLFISVGGIEQMVLAAAESYRWLPAGTISVAPMAQATELMIGALGSALELGLRVAAPVLAIVTLESIALGFVGRTMPAINVLSVGFALRVGAGIAVLALGIGVIRVAIDGVIDETLVSLRMWATGGAP